MRRYGAASAGSSAIGQPRPGRLGVHQFYDSKIFANINKKLFDAMDRSRDQVVTGLLLEFFGRMGVEDELLAISSRVAPWEPVHWLSDEELRATNLDNVDVPAKARLVGYGNGVAIVEVRFSRSDADYKVEIYCDADERLVLLATIESRNPITMDYLQDWGLYDGLSLEDGTSLTRTEIQLVPTKEGGMEVTLRLRAEGRGAASFSGIRSFNFEASDEPGVWADKAARDLSFDLPTDFAGMHVLPRTCLQR